MISAYLRTISLVKAILFSGLFISIADGIAAVLSNYWMKSVNPDRVFKFVASGVFGMKAFTGNTEMVVAGLFFHFLIAMTFTTFFFIVASTFKNLLNSVLIAGICYGCGIWLVMNFIVIPLSKTPSVSFETSTIIVGIIIHIFIIGIPIVWLAKQHLNVTPSSA